MYSVTAAGDVDNQYSITESVKITKTLIIDLAITRS